MANYCIEEDVEILLQLTFNSTSQPTSTQITSIITFITQEIDVHLANIGVTTQPTNANLLGMLKKYSAYGVACIVGNSYFGNNNSVTNTQPNFYCEQYQKLLDMIDNKSSMFNISSGQGNSVVLHSQVTEGIDTVENITKDDIGEIQW